MISLIPSNFRVIWCYTHPLYSAHSGTKESGLSVKKRKWFYEKNYTCSPYFGRESVSPNENLREVIKRKGQLWNCELNFVQLRRIHPVVASQSGFLIFWPLKWPLKFNCISLEILFCILKMGVSITKRVFGISECSAFFNLRSYNHTIILENFPIRGLLGTSFLN